MASSPPPAQTPAYDFNFHFPVPESLKSKRVELVPLIPSKHALPLFTSLQPHPSLFTYLPFGPFPTLESFVGSFLEVRVCADRGCLGFVVYDLGGVGSNLNASSESESSELGIGLKLEEAEAEAKAKAKTKENPERKLAGMIGLLNTSPENLSTEIGFLIILPAFQRTYVAKNAVGLLLKYCLDVPCSPSSSPSPATRIAARDGVSTPERGLGLRRVAYQANSKNTRSINTANRLGFRQEAIIRWQRVLPVAKDASVVGNDNGIREYMREGDPKRECAGRDTALFALCWDEWEEGSREKVGRVMARVV